MEYIGRAVERLDYTVGLSEMGLAPALGSQRALLYLLKIRSLVKSEGHECANSG